MNIERDQEFKREDRVYGRGFRGRKGRESDIIIL